MTKRERLLKLYTTLDAGLLRLKDEIERTPLDAEDDGLCVDFGRLGYEGYFEYTGGKTFDGRDMPTSDALPERIRAAWDAASTRIIQQVAALRHWPPTAPPELRDGDAEDAKRPPEPEVGDELVEALQALSGRLSGTGRAERAAEAIREEIGRALAAQAIGTRAR